MKIVDYKEFLNLFKYNEQIKDLIDEYIVYSCLNIASNAKFPTDYTDVKEHLFESDDYIRLFIVDDSNKIPQIKGFLISALEEGYNDNVILHCHGIILDPSIQGKGYSKVIVNKAIEMTNPDVVTAKTHNPRCFNAFANLNGAVSYYPNEFDDMPKDILELAKSDEFINNTNEQLIYLNAYPDEKIQQSHRNEDLHVVFDRLAPTDAQAIVVVLNDQKLDLGKNILKLKRLNNGK